MNFFRAALDTDTGTWKLFAWTDNEGSNIVGQYNYNTSVNDIGSVASTTAVLHQGPLTGTYFGNEVGAFGLVDGNLFLREDADGNNAQLAYTDGVPPAVGSVLSAPDLYAGTPYCWGLVTSCGTSDPRIPAYVHNVGRTLRQTDGKLATYYSFRHWDGSRADKQVWYVASSDIGTTWSAPATVFADGNALTVDGQPTAADGFFSSVESVQQPNICRMYFNTKDAGGNYVMVSATTGSGCDALFAETALTARRLNQSLHRSAGWLGLRVSKKVNHASTSHWLDDSSPVCGEGATAGMKERGTTALPSSRARPPRPGLWPLSPATQGVRGRG